MEEAAAISYDLLPEKSRQNYIRRYNAFKAWRCKRNLGESFDQNVVLSYVKHMHRNMDYSSSTLWTYYSMLKACIEAIDHVDMSKYYSVTKYIKDQRKNDQPKQALTLTTEHVNTFIHEAPDGPYFFAKVVLAVGVSGLCRCSELANFTKDSVTELDNSLLFTIRYAKNYVERSFTVVGYFYTIVKRYLDMRAQHSQHKFFLTYRGGVFINQQASSKTIGTVPKMVASFLGLENPERYTSHSIKRTSATVYVDSGATTDDLMRMGKWRSRSSAGRCVDHAPSTELKNAHQITNAIISAYSGVRPRATSTIESSSVDSNMSCSSDPGVQPTAITSFEHEIAYMPSHWSKRYNATEIFPYYFKFCEDITKEARSSYKHELDVPYGTSDRTKYDIYGTDLPKDAPILLFLHGGYWMEFSKDLSGFIVPNFVSNGIKVIVGGYDLCPNVTISEIVRQTKALAEKILIMAKSLGSKGVWISGHSAGAHLAASLLHDQNWLDLMRRHSCRDFLKGFFLIGGIYALEPLLRVSVNETIKLTPNEISTLSFAPLQEKDDETKDFEPVQKIRVIVTVGESDSPIFVEESRRYARRLTKMVDIVEFVLIRDDTDHFDIVENLVKHDFVLSRIMVDNMKRGF